MTTHQQAQSVRDAFSENLRRIRGKRGLSQGDLARLVGMHPTEISALERAQREPRLETLIKLSAALATPINEFVTGIEWWPRVLPPQATDVGRFHVAPAED